MLTAASALTSWTFDPVAVGVLLIAAGWYGRGVLLLQRRGGRWPARRMVSFGLGLLTIAGVTLWWVGAYAHTLFWVYTVQIMMLLVVSPALLMFGKPVTLSRALQQEGRRRPILARIADARAMNLLSNPAFGALLLPVVSMVVFFTAILPASLAHYVVYELLHLVLLLAGLVMSLPLADEGAQTSSLSLAAGILFGFLELLADAIPGIAIRLRTTLLAPEHYLAVHRTWGPSRLHDQQLGGAIVWFLAETIDLPVLALLVFRWIRTDEREAIVIDRRLDQQEQELASVDAEVDLQRPWWETDATVFGDRRAAALRKSSGRSRRPGS
ncbi:MAG TPA: cytochrome c oxidase assembly protein [Frankiaceae bacterium]|nr:cytochrome c oxidase assembly protein [Frankiaceae bacterium]